MSECRVCDGDGVCIKCDGLGTGEPTEYCDKCKGNGLCFACDGTGSE